MKEESHDLQKTGIPDATGFAPGTCCGVSGADWVAVPESKPIHRQLVVCRSGDWHGVVDDQQDSGPEQMRQIDIDSLDEATLTELKARIVERLQYSHHQRTTAALQEIRVGSGVEFEGPGGVLVRGVVICRNKNTVTVHADDNRQWNVSPTLLKPTGVHVLDTAAQIQSDDGKVVSFPKPERR
ncbi:hypothetical protein [Rhizobium sp. SL86]|uniref:hypothetical protein n=1 Tax=Rhizobium sp. SL86 TaxID=2995148 RepID=UPI0022723A59|nr:hypothetical protein [Rhizobium sp. SL86]MCY1667623.1 hypothetical protein [Rhizobium sp. SL86]